MIGIINQLLPLLPARAGAALVCRLAFRPYRYRSKPGEQDFLKSGRHLLYGPGLHAWRWGVSGPLIVLVHGWGGASVQWHRFVPALIDAGFQVVVPDIAGHGQSAGKRIGFDVFADSLAALRRSLDESGIHALVGHSAGGLGMMAARYLHGLDARKFVCIATPSYPYPPVKVVQKKVRTPERVTGLFRDALARQFRAGWDQITAQAFRESTASELLLVFDRRDRYLDGDDAARILAAWPSARVHWTEDLGHENLIRAEATIAAVVQFLTI
ncbi:MAG: alpha/beta fold hydrolase [Steroidobacteraceae bacterium]